MARKSKGQGPVETATGSSGVVPDVQGDVQAVLSLNDVGGVYATDVPGKGGKAKKPREVRYYLTGLDGMNIRQVIGEFGTLRQLHKYCDPLWGAITRGLRDIAIIKGKVVNEGP